MRFFRSRGGIILMIATLLCLVLIAFTATGRRNNPLANALGYVIVPVQTGLGNALAWVGNIGYHFNQTGYLLSENQRLQQELEELLLVVGRLELLEASIAELNQLFQMAERYPRFDYIGAHVVSRDNNNWNSRFNIDRGGNHGIELNKVIVAHGGLVGRVSFVADTFATVTPIIDDTSSVGAIVNRNNVVGLARGDLLFSREGLLTFEVPLGTDIIVGDEISTSTFGTIFPPGIGIGTVVEILPPTAQEIVAVIEPHANFEQLNSVLVILDVVE